MDDKIEIILGEEKNVDSVNVDNYTKIKLSNKSSYLTEYNIRSVVSATEVFNREREETNVYRIYGKFEYLSLLNGIKDDYIELNDFFTTIKTDEKRNILNSFDFYLVKPTTGYTQISGTEKYIRNFEVIALPEHFDLYMAGFSNNVYNDQAHAFNLNIDIDVGSYRDDFNFPLEELFIFAQYKPSSTPLEEMSATTWNETTGDIEHIPYTPTSLDIGDEIEGDLINYYEDKFLQEVNTNQTFYIRTRYIDSGTKYLQWKYNPFISLRLMYFEDKINKGNTGNTSYHQVVSIPDYATNIGNGNYVWRRILPQGFIDPLTGVGVNYPFVNKRRYLFSSIVLDVIPDLEHGNTLTVYNEIKFGVPDIINTKPLTDLSNFGKPCQ